MSDHDESRRRFLRTGAGAAAGAAAAASGAVSLGFSVRAWAGELKTLTAHEGRTLHAVARRIFPHPSLGDMYYAVVVDDLDAEAAGSADTARIIKNGVAALDGAMGVPFADLSPGHQTAVLERMESSPIFAKVKGKAIVSLYNNPLVWREFGYEGPSAHLGGYLHRGFNDLAWLPDPPESASPKAG